MRILYILILALLQIPFFPSAINVFYFGLLIGVLVYETVK